MYDITPVPAWEVAEAWKRWCGETSWVKLMRDFGYLGGTVRWYDGFPRSASAIPLVFRLFLPNGEHFDGQSRLKDIRNGIVKARDVNRRVVIYECGICDWFHHWSWNGDCRDDANRFFPDELAERLGISESDIEIRSMDERVAADRGEIV